MTTDPLANLLNHPPDVTYTDTQALADGDLVDRIPSPRWTVMLPDDY